MTRNTYPRSRCRAALIGGAMLIMFAAAAVLAAPAFSQDKPAPKKDAFKSDPYPLAICPVSGEKLGSMGDPVVYDHEGREVRFCCNSCISEFKKEPAKYLTKVDEKIIEQQLPHYPLTTCVVSKESLKSEHMEAANIVVGNRLVRLCCKSCEREVRKNPAQAFEKLDAAVIKQQKDSYPLETCVVSGAKLSSMGPPVNYVINNRLVCLCCENCIKKLRANPLVYFSKLDEAWKAKGAGGAGNHDHDHDHSGHDHPH